MVHTCNKCNRPFKKLWMLTRHLQDRKFPCRPQVIPAINQTPAPAIFRTHAPKVVRSPKIPEPVPQIDPEAGPGPSTQANREEILQNNTPSDNESNITQEEIDYLIALGLIEPEIEE